MLILGQYKTCLITWAETSLCFSLAPVWNGGSGPQFCSLKFMETSQWNMRCCHYCLQCSGGQARSSLDGLLRHFSSAEELTAVVTVGLRQKCRISISLPYNFLWLFTLVKIQLGLLASSPTIQQDHIHLLICSYCVLRLLWNSEHISACLNDF